jgi:glucose-6-phosphate isomerase
MTGRQEGAVTVADFASQPVGPYRIVMDLAAGSLSPEGPTVVRRLSDLEGLFRDQEAWRRDLAEDDRVVYQVSSSPVPEAAREVAQSITTILPGACGGEFWMTKGHQHPNHQGEIYLGVAGVGGLLMFDGTDTRWLDMAPGVIAYIPPGWAHRSINVGNAPYSFLAVYPGGAGHDYGWVLEHGMGRRALRDGDGYRLVDWDA